MRLREAVIMNIETVKESNVNLINNTICKKIDFFSIFLKS